MTRGASLDVRYGASRKRDITAALTNPFLVDHRRNAPSWWPWTSRSPLVPLTVTGRLSLVPINETVVNPGVAARGIGRL